MTKRKFRWEFSIGELIQITGLIVAAVVLGVRFDTRLERLELKVDDLDVKVDSIDKRLVKLEGLVNLDLSWRYLYQNDPMRKHLRPIYHPDTRTLELVSIIPADSTNVRKP